MSQTDRHYSVLRLKSKDARAAIIQKLAQDFNLTQVIAVAYIYARIGVIPFYFEEHANVSLSTGQIAYEAVAAHEPAGKHIRLTRKVTVKVKLIDFNSDLEDSGRLWSRRPQATPTRSHHKRGL